jgi:hypothetical protein
VEASLPLAGPVSETKAAPFGANVTDKAGTNLLRQPSMIQAELLLKADFSVLPALTSHAMWRR